MISGVSSHISSLHKNPSHFDITPPGHAFNLYLKSNRDVATTPLHTNRQVQGQMEGQPSVLDAELQATVRHWESLWAL